MKVINRYVNRDTNVTTVLDDRMRYDTNIESETDNKYRRSPQTNRMNMEIKIEEDR